MDVKIAPDWKERLAPEFEKPYFADLTQFVRQEYATRRIYPRGSNIFRAFDKCPFDRLKVVVIDHFQHQTCAIFHAAAVLIGTMV